MFHLHFLNTGNSVVCCTNSFKTSFMLQWYLSCHIGKSKENSLSASVTMSPMKRFFFAELKLKLKKPKTKRRVLLLQHANRKGFNALSTFHELYTDWDMLDVKQVFPLLILTWDMKLISVFSEKWNCHTMAHLLLAGTSVAAVNLVNHLMQHFFLHERHLL